MNQFLKVSMFALVSSFLISSSLCSISFFYSSFLLPSNHLPFSISRYFPFASLFRPPTALFLWVSVCVTSPTRLELFQWLQSLYFPVSLFCAVSLRLTYFYSKLQLGPLCFLNPVYLLTGARGSVVVKALCYKLEGRVFDSRLGEFLNLPNPCGRTRPGVYSASNIN
jgi:hypothetical protein